MGFRNNGYGTVWGQPIIVSPSMTKMRLTTSNKDRNGEYITDFSEYVTFVGKNAAAKAAKLKEKDRIKLGSVESCTKYNAASQETYHNYKIFEFSTQSEYENNSKGGGKGNYNKGGYNGGGNNYNQNQYRGRNANQFPSQSAGNVDSAFDDEDLDISKDDLPF